MNGGGKALFQPFKEPTLRPMVNNAETPSHVARLATDRSSAQRLADFLTETLDEQEVVVAAFESADGRWTTAIYFSNPPNETAVRALVALEAGAEAANTLIFERVEAKDWVKASLEGLAPVEAGRFFVHGQHDRARLRANRIGIEIEAALAFGTGHHGTTRGCLLALDYLVKRHFARPKRRLSLSPFTSGWRAHRGSRVRGRSRVGGMRILDVGTGTGVLAIAAAKALHNHVLASDIDRRAVLVARENARLNGASPLVEFIHVAGLDAHHFGTRGPFDLVLANILLGPLVRLSRPMTRLLAPGAWVVLSGLLNNQAQTAVMAYRAQGLVLERRIMLEGWTTLVMRRGYPLS
jgi:ribosomal protein L11 methyltransferase